MSWSKSALVTPLIGGVLGVALFAGTFGLDVVRPANLGWLMRHDTQTYLLAWHHFRREPWQWPVGAITGVGHPVGTTIGNTDALPIVAIPLKLLHPLLPDPFQFLGAWLLACFVLQGVFGALLTRQVTADRTLQILGAALFVQTPALVHRAGHTALCAHWLVLAAIWLCCDRRPEREKTRFTRWVVLCAVAAATQPYLAVMVLGLALATFASDALDAVRARRAGLWPFAGMAAVVSAMAVVFWQSGYFVVGSATDLQLGGVGFFSMNLLSPVMGMGYSTLLPPIAAATAGQYEGLIYFGAGWLALSGMAGILWAMRGATAPPLRLAWLAVVLFTLLALSPVVTAGRTVLVDLNAWSPAVMSVLRSSGRFGWVAMYVTFAAVIAAVTTKLTRPVAVAVLTAAVTLQAVDLRDAYAAIRGRAVSPAWTEWANPLVNPVWQAAVPAYRHLVMVPPDMCAAVWPDPAAPHLPFSLIAGSHGATVNSGNAGRYDVQAILAYCASLESDVRAGRLDDESLYVVSAAMRPVLAAAARSPVVCGDIDGFTVCVTAATYPRWRAAAVQAHVTMTAP